MNELIEKTLFEYEYLLGYTVDIQFENHIQVSKDGWNVFTIDILTNHYAITIYENKIFTYPINLIYALENMVLNSFDVYKDNKNYIKGTLPLKSQSP